MIPQDLISLRDAAKEFGISVSVLHEAKHAGLFEVWPRELGRHYARRKDLQAWWEIHRVVKPKHIKRQPKAIEPLDGAVNMDKTQRNFRGENWMGGKK